jgi:hypothetical protein
MREVKIQIVNSAIDKISSGLDFKDDEQDKLVEKSIKNLETLQ